MAERWSLKETLNKERIRAKGMVKFILIVGFVRFALPLTVISKLVMYVLYYGLTGAYLEEFFTGHKILFFFLEFLFEGITFGWLIWVFGKKEGYPKLNQ
jgi:hypothetical protein